MCAVGGKAKSNRRREYPLLGAPAIGLQEVDGALCMALQDVLAGTLEPNISTAAASIVRTIRTLRAATYHEERLAKLEAEHGIHGAGTA